MLRTTLPLLLLPLAAVAATTTATPAAKTETAPAAPSLVIGSKVSPEIFAKLDWIQGAAPTAWEPGAVYIFECWATWCGPCIANIPHVNELHKKYGAKGLHVYGIDVWEDGREKVAAFVQKKGDGMSYPVAYTGRGSAFEATWLKAAGIRGIPHAFVVKDGEIIMLAHPAELADDVIEGFLGNADGRAKALATLESNRAKKREFAEKYVATNKAIASKDPVAAEKALAALKAVSPDEDRIPVMEIQLAILKKDWAVAGAKLDALPESVYKTMNLQTVFRQVAYTANIDKDFALKAIAAFRPVLEKIDDPMGWQEMMKIRWNLGDKPAALEAAKRALAASKSERFAKMGYAAETYTKIVASLEAGTLPDDATISTWNREAYAASKAAAKQ